LDEFHRRAAVSVYEGEPQTGMGYATFGTAGGYGTSYNFK
jgi:hypothetical protein